MATELKPLHFEPEICLCGSRETVIGNYVRHDDYANLEQQRDTLKDALEMCERCITNLYPVDGYEEEHDSEWYAVNKVLNAARAALADLAQKAQKGATK